VQSQSFDLKGLARYLGRDARDLEKLAVQGRLPGRRIGGDWKFQRADVTQWLEQQMSSLSDDQLVRFEGAMRARSDASTEPAGLVLRSLMSPETTAVPMEGRTKGGVIRSLVEVANGRWMIFDPARVVELVRRREEASSTALPGGVAVPHPGRRLNEEIGESLVAFGRTASPIAFGGERGEKTDLFFLVLCKDDRTHLQCLARLARMIQRSGFLDRLRAAAVPADALDVVEQFEREVS
jgi:PTS system nitrogen regulatory IIA component